MSDLDFGPKPGIPPCDGGRSEKTQRSSVAAAHTQRGDEELDRSLRPKKLEDFIGQQRVREQLQIYIDAAKHREESLDHALFAGPPGLGKCVTPDTMVFTTHGMEPIGNLGTMGGESWQPITRPIAGLYGVRTADYFYDNGEGPTLQVTTNSGYRVEGTPNHPLLVRTNEGHLQFRRLEELRNGDHVAIRIGAQVFGSETKLHIEGIGIPSLRDPAHMPDELTADLARLLGITLTGAKLSAAGDLVFQTDDARRAHEFARIIKSVFCIGVEEIGTGPLGTRWRVRSQRVGQFLQFLGLTPKGFVALPKCIYAAPRLAIAEFIRGLFWGVETDPVSYHEDRTIAAHLQLMLANLGIESKLDPDEQGWKLTASAEPPKYESFSDAEEIDDPYEHSGGHHHGSQPIDSQVRAASLQRVAQFINGRETESDPEPEVGFGMTAAGVLVAVDAENRGSYRRGGYISEDIVPVRVLNSGRVRVEAVSVSEVVPSERGRALVRESRNDHQALKMQSTRSKLRRGEMVALVWEPIVSIQPGYGYTVDVSVPDGHTFVGNGIICHNTTLANVVANELGSTMHTTSGPALEKKADVAAILSSLEENDVLFIDEIHRMSTAIEEVLYTAMEDYQIDIVLGQGPTARTLRLELEPFTLVGATTRTGLLTTPLRDRFGITQRLEYYDPEELADIVRRSARLLDLKLDSEAAIEIATRSRGTPRIANRLLRRVRDVAQVRYEGAMTLEVAHEALDLVDIDHEGLDRIDRRILEMILTNFGGGPVGLSTLAMSIGEEAHTIEDVYEPFLLQRGYIQRTPRGRIITERGRQHLGAAGYPTKQPDQLL